MLYWASKGSYHISDHVLILGYMIQTSLQQLIIERIQREGLITFAEYMRMALYEPGYGYYVTGPARMGWEGDYYTSTDVSTFFAHCMGRQLHQWWEKLGRPACFKVLEQGAGRGHLGQEVEDWAKQVDSAFHNALEYHTEDIRLGQDVHAHEASDKPVPAVILSNELIDAFPVHIVETRQAQLYEAYVDVEAGKLREVLDTPSTPEVADYLNSYNIPWLSFGDGWRAEINLDALRWMQQVAQRLRRG